MLLTVDRLINRLIIMYINISGLDRYRIKEKNIDILKNKFKIF